jgi:ankyrin repeat protein
VDADVESSFSHSVLSRRVRSFDSNLNILVPIKVDALANEAVNSVACGSCHAIFGCNQRQVSEHSELLNWAKHNKYQKINAFLSESSERSILVNQTDSSGNTALIVACQNGLEDIVQLLLRFGADPNISNNKGNTCLHYCFAYGFTTLSDILIRSGADEFKVNREGLTCYEGLTAADLDDL